ncbi:lysine--tRNA ligase, cytoplasmic-like protein [Tanacetum coccineum]
MDPATNDNPACASVGEVNLSKNAQKKLLKEEERRRKKEEKERTVLEQSSIQEKDPTKYFDNRLESLNAQKAAGMNPYPHKFQALTMSIPDFVDKYKSRDDLDSVKDEVSLAGRLMSVRASSKKRIFYDLHGVGGKVQVIAALENSDLDEAGFCNYHSSVKRFDIIGVIGFPAIKGQNVHVETPMLTTVAGGAAARPFVTHHNELNLDMFMRIAPELFVEAACIVTGGYKVKYHANGYDSEPIEIDFTPPFRRIDMIEALEKAANLSIPKDLASEEAREFLADACIKNTIVGQTCGTLSGVDMSLTLTQNLNDPVVQRQRLANQLKDRQSGDDEAMALDEAFCTALEYGLPPTAGWGLGIDRLAMLLTDSQNIKEVILFPAMKPQVHNERSVEGLVQRSEGSGSQDES